jgi:hypothetical protein
MPAKIPGCDCQWLAFENDNKVNPVLINFSAKASWTLDKNRTYALTSFRKMWSVGKP